MFSKIEAARTIREAASSIENDDEMFATQSLADYIESTETGVLEDRGRLSDSHVRTVYGEIAAAYQAGFEHGAGEPARAMGQAIRDAGLQV